MAFCRKWDVLIKSFAYLIILGVNSVSLQVRAGQVCYVAGEACSVFARQGYYERVCKPVIQCHWVPEPSPVPTPPSPPSPPPQPLPPPNQQCINNAITAESNCKASYNQLHDICTGFNAALGGAAGATSKWLYSKLVGSAVDDKTSKLIVSGAAATGYAVDDVLVPCTTLTAQAMEFCSAGAEKMKRECN